MHVLSECSDFIAEEGTLAWQQQLKPADTSVLDLRNVTPTLPVTELNTVGRFKNSDSTKSTTKRITI